MKHAISVTAMVAVCSLVAPAQVKMKQSADRVSVEIDGKPFTDFIVSGSDFAKPFLHPLRTADGKIVTRVWPMEEKAGEAKDHPHHRGLWFTHGDVNGYDFWSNEPSLKGNKKGSVVLEKIKSAKSGSKHGSITASFVWKDTTGKALLREDRTMTFHSDPKLRIVDFDVKFTGIESAKFGDTKEGFFALRLTAPLDGKHTGKMVSAEGKVGEKLIWGKRSPWVDYVGQLEGETVGVAIFDHAGNPKHPTYWHSRDYGLFAANIFGEHDFYNDKSKDGSMTLEPGKTWRFRYRVVIHKGDTQAAGIAGLYAKWK
ncbi:MAG: PmoA family protein [Bryobacteraceae bacterium]